MVASTQRKIRDGIAPPNAPLTVAVKKNNLPLRDRGQLMSSITSKSSASNVTIGTNRIQAKLMQYGGTITAKGTWLWIPGDPKTRTLQRRYGFSPTAVMKGLRSEGIRVWVQSKKGSSTGVVFAKRGKRGKQWTVYILKKSVKIPARPFLFFDDLDKDVINSYLTEAIEIKKEDPIGIP